MKNRSGYFITGTDTDVGKTFAAGKIAKYFREQGFKVGYFKAALSGMEWKDGNWILGDAEYVCDQAGLTEDPKKRFLRIWRQDVRVNGLRWNRFRNFLKKFKKNMRL